MVPHVNEIEHVLGTSISCENRLYIFWDTIYFHPLAIQIVKTGSSGRPANRSAF